MQGFFQKPVARETRETATSVPGSGVRRSIMVRAARTVALAVLGALVVAPAAAQETAGAVTFPNRAIHIVIPFPAGGPADIAARLIGQKMS